MTNLRSLAEAVIKAEARDHAQSTPHRRLVWYTALQKFWIGLDAHEFIALLDELDGARAAFGRMSVKAAEETKRAELWHSRFIELKRGGTVPEVDDD